MFVAARYHNALFARESADFAVGEEALYLFIGSSYWLYVAELVYRASHSYALLQRNAGDGREQAVGDVVGRQLRMPLQAHDVVDHRGKEVLLMDDGDDGEKTLPLGTNYRNKRWRDFLANREEVIETDDEGTGTFTCNGGSVSVWVIEEVL